MEKGHVTFHVPLDLRSSAQDDAVAELKAEAVPEKNGQTQGMLSERARCKARKGGSSGARPAVATTSGASALAVGRD